MNECNGNPEDHELKKRLVVLGRPLLDRKSRDALGRKETVEMLPVVKEDRCKWSWHWEVFVCDLKVTGGRLAWSLDGARIEW